MLPSRFTYPSPGFHHYWTQGRGKAMYDRLSPVPSQAELEAKAPLLFATDAHADAVIEEVYFTRPFMEANALVDKAFTGSLEAGEWPISLRNILVEMQAEPTWLDWEKLELGASLCRRSGSVGLIVLRNYCLMGGYESAAINKPLIYTGALKKGASKRMAETIEFWVNATAQDGLRPGREGLRMALRVRLMHAFARGSILRHTDWDSSAWGLPVNQWDMVATNLGFSLAFLDGLRNLGFRPTISEVEGLLHFWKYVGWLIGIPVAELPDTELDAIRVLYMWTITQPPADADTVALARALMEEPLHTAFPTRMWQKRLLIATHLTYNYFLLGERSCTAIGLPRARGRWYPYVVRGVKGTQELLVHIVPRMRRFSVWLGRKAQERIMTEFLHGHRSALAARGGS